MNPVSQYLFLFLPLVELSLLILLFQDIFNILLSVHISNASSRSIVSLIFKNKSRKTVTTPRTTLDVKLIWSERDLFPEVNHICIRSVHRTPLYLRIIGASEVVKNGIWYYDYLSRVLFSFANILWGRRMNSLVHRGLVLVTRDRKLRQRFMFFGPFENTRQLNPLLWSCFFNS